jgi:hypothetical protein
LPGDRVEPGDVVARCSLPGQVYFVDVSRTLGIPRHQAVLHMSHAPGNRVGPGQVLAEHRSRWPWRRGKCRVPVGGRLLAVRNGVALIESPPRIVEMCASLKGQVLHVLPQTGVVISAEVALIQGVWGSGGQGVGFLRVLADDPCQPLRAEAIDQGCLGSLLVAGQISDYRTLQRAAKAGVAGLIVGSVGAGLCSQLPHIEYPILVTEGFGTLAMATPVFDLLRSHTGRQAVVTVAPQNGWGPPAGTRRPEVLISLEGESAPCGQVPAPLALRAGLEVRGLRAPYLGCWGRIHNLPPHPQVLESGVRAQVAEVELEDSSLVLIPVANLEVIRRTI